MCNLIFAISVFAGASGIDLSTAVVASGLNRPVGAASSSALPNHLFVIEKRGVIRVINLTNNTLLVTPLLDINSIVINPLSGSDERGLLGLAFHPNYASNRHFYVNYINNAGGTVIARYTANEDLLTADATTAVTLKTATQPQANHNGGCLRFGPDGKLYASLGDGGGQGDAHGTIGNGQALDTLLGKILRLNVDISSPYVPADNPFVGVEGVLGEIWAYGLRNPWQFSFDRLTGDLYIADVGQDLWEEVNFASASSLGGENYGWRCMEGLHCFNSPSGPNCTCEGSNLSNPVIEYGRTEGISVTGGFVYRGARLVGEYGNYFFGDFSSGRVWTTRVTPGNPPTATDKAQRLQFVGLTAFGEDAHGELYLINGTGTTTGVVRKIIPACAQTGDINSDCTIDLDDALILVDALLDVDLGDPVLLARSDINSDGVINGDDIQAWIATLP